jgi:hypothetical protein
MIHIKKNKINIFSTEITDLLKFRNKTDFILRIKHEFTGEVMNIPIEKLNEYNGRFDMFGIIEGVPDETTALPLFTTELKVGTHYYEIFDLENNKGDEGILLVESDISETKAYNGQSKTNKVYKG